MFALLTDAGCIHSPPVWGGGGYACFRVTVAARGRLIQMKRTQMKPNELTASVVVIHKFLDWLQIAIGL